MRILWTAAVVLLAFVGVLYTVMATQGRAQDRFSQAVPLTLDGQAYIEYAIHPENGQFIELKPDLGIIRWMNENIEGLPIIMEAISNDGILYKWGGRISINTGLPAVIGWDWHQKQQRGLFNMPGFIEQRVGNVNAFDVGPGGLIYGPNYVDQTGTVVAIDPADGAVTTIADIPGYPTALRTIDDHRLLVLANLPSALYEVDLSTLPAADDPNPPEDPRATVTPRGDVALATVDNFTVAPDGTIYVTSFNQPTVLAIAPDGTTRTITIGTPS